MVMLFLANGTKPEDRNPVSPLEFAALRTQNNVFGGVAASSYDDPVLTGRGDPERVTRAQVTPNFFELFGVSAAIGRTFSPSEDFAKQQFNSVISYDLWQHKLGADPGVVGRSFVLGKQAYTVIGVMPEESKYAFGSCAVWVPESFDAQSLRPNGLKARSLNVFAHLRKGVSLREARADADTILKRVARNDPVEKGWTTRVVGLRETMQDGNARVQSELVMSVVVFVLLIACANVAGMFLARLASRQNEFVVRVALGAARWRLVQQLLGELLGLAFFSGGLGWVGGISRRTWKRVRARRIPSHYGDPQLTLFRCLASEFHCSCHCTGSFSNYCAVSQLCSRAPSDEGRSHDGAEV
jgi:hypothetical protein